MKLRSFIYLGISGILLLLVFTIDMIRKNVELEAGLLNVVRDLSIVSAFVLVYLFVEHRRLHEHLTPVRKVGLAMIYSIALAVVALGLMFTVRDGFEIKELTLLPLNYPAIFLSSLLGTLFGVFAILLIRLLRDLILFKRRKSTRRNFVIFIILLFLAALSAMPLRPLETALLTNILFASAVMMAIVNSFRLSWIAYLTKREKIIGLVYGFFLTGALIALNVLIGQSTPIGKSMLYYSLFLREFVLMITVFGNIYFGMAFVSTLFHLPTAEAFDRKTSEVTSLHSLSRLITQVFDFQELVDTVTTMTMQVSGARSCWLEIFYPIEAEKKGTEGVPAENGPEGYTGRFQLQIASMKNIEQSDIEYLMNAASLSIRDRVWREPKPIIVDDMTKNAIFATFDKSRLDIGSLVVVPLVAHSGLIGVLYATNAEEFGFFQDDVQVISAYADQAAVAIENSRLIKKSIERERLLREMMVAREIQKKLLPQTLPSIPTVEIDAISSPAFEVGGDYYDFVYLDSKRLGIAVGDVSGKGVSAAFYMSEVKGIFQSLSRIYHSPREFMVKANEALQSSIDKHSFVSLIYAVLDVDTGALTFARAGHCPLLHVSGENICLHRPSGMGLGMHYGPAFEENMEESTVMLKPGDVCVLYTDGVTEARNGEDEFGYERLQNIVAAAKEKTATELKEHIVESIRIHIDSPSNEDDDLTVMVLKWRGITELHEV